jgi:hypothetical protein
MASRKNITDMEIWDIKLKKLFCSMLFTFPSTGGVLRKPYSSLQENSSHICSIPYSFPVAFTFSILLSPLYSPFYIFSVRSPIPSLADNLSFRIPFPHNLKHVEGMLLACIYCTNKYLFVQSVYFWLCLIFTILHFITFCTH